MPSSAGRRRRERRGHRSLSLQQHQVAARQGHGLPEGVDESRFGGQGAARVEDGLPRLPPQGGGKGEVDRFLPGVEEEVERVVLHLLAPPVPVRDIDLADFQSVADPTPQPRNSISITSFGADPHGVRDSAPAFDLAIRAAKALHKSVYIPAGTFQVNGHIIVDDVTIEGAGSWWSIVKGHQVTLNSPAPDGSVHTGVGFYGKYAADGGSHNVRLSNFAIEGDVRERIDTDQVNGVGGALSNSTIDGLYIHHTKVGIWLDGPMNNVTVKNTVIETRSPMASISTRA